jgi:hypothetical protein
VGATRNNEVPARVSRVEPKVEMEEDWEEEEEGGKSPVVAVVVPPRHHTHHQKGGRIKMVVRGDARVHDNRDVVAKLRGDEGEEEAVEESEVAAADVKPDVNEVCFFVVVQ